MLASLICHIAKNCQFDNTFIADTQNQLSERVTLNLECHDYQESHIIVIPMSQKIVHSKNNEKMHCSNCIFFTKQLISPNFTLISNIPIETCQSFCSSWKSLQSQRLPSPCYNLLFFCHSLHVKEFFHFHFPKWERHYLDFWVGWYAEYNASLVVKVSL